MYAHSPHVLITVANPDTSALSDQTKEVEKKSRTGFIEYMKTSDTTHSNQIYGNISEFSLSEDYGGLD